MLKVNQLSGFGGRKSSGEITVASHYIADQDNGTSATYTNVPIGEASSDRLILLSVKYSVGTGGAYRSVSNITYNGVSITANQISTANDIFLDYRAGSFLFKQPDSVGTTANVTVTLNGNANNHGLFVLSAKGLKNFTQTASASNVETNFGHSFISNVLTVPSGDTGICIIHTNNRAMNWADDSVEVDGTDIANAENGSIALIIGDGSSKTANAVGDGGNSLESYLHVVAFTPK